MATAAWYGNIFRGFGGLFSNVWLWNQGVFNYFIFLIALYHLLLHWDSWGTDKGGRGIRFEGRILLLSASQKHNHTRTCGTCLQLSCYSAILRWKYGSRTTDRDRQTSRQSIGIQMRRVRVQLIYLRHLARLWVTGYGLRSTFYVVLSTGWDLPITDTHCLLKGRERERWPHGCTDTLARPGCVRETAADDADYGIRNTEYAYGVSGIEYRVLRARSTVCGTSVAGDEYVQNNPESRSRHRTKPKQGKKAKRAAQQQWVGGRERAREG